MKQKYRKLVGGNGFCLSLDIFFICGIVLFLLLYSVTAHAEDENIGSIELQCSFPGAKFMLYQVGTIAEDGETIILNDTLSEYQNKIDWSSYDAADILAEYVENKSLQPILTETTDEDAMLTFSNLEKGVYLICGTKTTFEGSVYTSSPVLVQLPMTQNGTLTMHPVVVHKKYKKYTKNTRDKIPQTGQLWWPVFVFSCIGIALVMTGYRCSKKR